MQVTVSIICMQQVTKCYEITQLHALNNVGQLDCYLLQNCALHPYKAALKVVRRCALQFTCSIMNGIRVIKYDRKLYKNMHQ